MHATTKARRDEQSLSFLCSHLTLTGEETFLSCLLQAFSFSLSSWLTVGFFFVELSAMSQSSLLSKSAPRQTRDSAKVACRSAVCGNLSSLFGKGSYADSSSPIQGGCLSSHLRGQFVQPRHLAGAGGGPAFNEMTYGRNSVLETHFFEAQHFTFKNPASPKIMEAKERFNQVFLNPPPAFLACVQLITGVLDGELIMGAPFLTVLGALVAGPRRELLRASEVWPGLSALQPIGLPLDEDADMSLLGASVQALTRTNTTSTVKMSMQSYLPDMVYTLEGKALCEIGFTMTTTQPTSGAALF
jgi:hypothetical protein